MYLAGKAIWGEYGLAEVQFEVIPCNSIALLVNWLPKTENGSSRIGLQNRATNRSNPHTIS
jgi:hypothetical protein